MYVRSKPKRSPHFDHNPYHIPKDTPIHTIYQKYGLGWLLLGMLMAFSETCCRKLDIVLLEGTIESGEVKDMKYIIEVAVEQARKIKPPPAPPPPPAPGRCAAAPWLARPSYYYYHYYYY